MSSQYINYVGRQLTNVLFHIDCNRNVLGDTRTLDDIKISLERILKDHEKLLGKKLT